MCRELPRIRGLFWSPGIHEVNNSNGQEWWFKAEAVSKGTVAFTAGTPVGVTVYPLLENSPILVYSVRLAMQFINLSSHSTDPAMAVGNVLRAVMSVTGFLANHTGSLVDLFQIETVLAYTSNPSDKSVSPSGC